MDQREAHTAVMIPRLKPVAPDTWEIRAELDGDEDETNRVPIEFPGPSTIVGAYCSVIAVTDTGGLLVPTLDDLLVLIDLDNQRRFTSGPSQGQTSAASRATQYVTLAAVDSRVRDLYINCQSPRPVVGMTFRWKRSASGGPYYQDVQVAVSLMVLPGAVPP